MYCTSSGTKDVFTPQHQTFCAAQGPAPSLPSTVYRCTLLNVEGLLNTTPSLSVEHKKISHVGVFYMRKITYIIFFVFTVFCNNFPSLFWPSAVEWTGLTAVVSGVQGRNVLHASMYNRVYSLASMLSVYYPPIPHHLTLLHR